MHNSGTLSCPFMRQEVSKDLKVLATRLSFEVKLTDVDDYYEIKVRMCANGSKMVQGVDFSESYAPTVDADSYRFMMNISAMDRMIITFIDASNAFQTNVIQTHTKEYMSHCLLCI